MAPSTTMGAIILLWRRAATKVIVSHLPSGTAPITRTPRGARPLSLTMFVLTAVSSINTAGQDQAYLALVSPAPRPRHICSPRTQPADEGGDASAHKGGSA